MQLNQKIKNYLRDGPFERPPPDGLPVVLGQPPAFPCPRPDPLDDPLDEF